MTPLLELTHVAKSYGGVHALKGVSFDLRPGEVHAVVGENGAGKSTLMKVIAGAVLPDRGELRIAGERILDHSPQRAKSLGVAMIHQQPALFPDLTVAENIGLACDPFVGWRTVNWSQRRKRARELLERVGAAIVPEAEVASLSMPEQQLVEIAKAIGSNARVIIMDEPTASLADCDVERLFRNIRELTSRGAGVVYISHRLDELPQIADRVTVLRDGAGLGSRSMSEVDRSELIRLMVGRDVAAIYPQRSVKLGDVALEVRNVCQDEACVRDVSFSIRKGEVFALAGLIGAGRTELARTIFGLTPADRGQILIDGRSVSIRSPAEAIALGLAYVPEDRRRHGVILDLSVAANSTLAILDRIQRFGWIDRRQDAAAAEEAVARFRVKTPSIHSLAGQLSGGNQQKVALARWLATQPRILILDEPTQGIDIGSKAEIYEWIGRLAAEGLAILMISSELPEVLGLADRIGVMRNGRLVGVLPKSEATQESILSLALGAQHGSEVSASRNGELPETSNSL